MSSPSMTSVVVMSDGCALTVKLLDNASGNSSNPTPKPLLIVHHSAVGASDHTETEASYGFLVEKFRVLVFDARGCGQSDKLTENGWELSHKRWVQDIEELRAWAQASTFYLAGNSYGAIIALEYALTYPSRLYGLILRAGLAYGPRMAENAMKRVSIQEAVDVARQQRLWNGTLRDSQDFAASLGDIGKLFAYKKESTLEEEEEKPIDTSAWTVFHTTHNAAFSACLPQFDVRARLGEVKTRSLVVVGRHDWLTPVEGALEIVEGIRGGGADADLVVFEESGHDPTSEEVERWRSTVWEWLGKESEVVREE